ncbi:MAG: PIN domain-containing protein [Candidatus Omnitrophica bacterium]|nr:PIN domain-containing protein [Candidatus Omnitrophota bacterium]
MIRILIDSSALFSAFFSERGHSRDLIILALKGEINLVESEYILEEVSHHLEIKAPPFLNIFQIGLENLKLDKVKPTKSQVLAAAKYVAEKDAPIIAAAKKGKVDLLVTLDKKHLLGNPKLEKFTGSAIVTPAAAVASIKAKG